MASRIMHLIIAKRIGDEFNLNINRFSIGNMVPDAFHKDYSSKKDSHYVFPGKINYGDRYLDYDGFLKEYENELKDDMFLGYLCHLIADDEWLRKIYVPKLLDEDDQVIESRARYYYGDYGRLNRILIKEFSLINNFSYEPIPMRRIDADRVNQYLLELSEDFTRSYDSYQLKVMDESEIFDYIDSTVELIRSYIQLNNLR